MSALSTTPPILTIWARRRSGADDAHQFTYQLLCRYCPAGFSAGAGAGAGVAGFSVGAGAGAGAGFAAGVVVDFSGATVVGPGDVLVSVLPVGAFLGATVGGFLAQPLSVNATNTRPANAVRTTRLMVIPFRKTIPCTVR